MSVCPRTLRISRIEDALFTQRRKQSRHQLRVAAVALEVEPDVEGGRGSGWRKAG